MSTNYEQAKEILGQPDMKSLYKEHALQKAQALSMLALADAIRGEATVPQDEWQYAYALMERGGDGPYTLVAVYTDESKAYGKADALSKNATMTGTGRFYVISPYRLNYDYM